MFPTIYARVALGGKHRSAPVALPGRLVLIGGRRPTTLGQVDALAADRQHPTTRRPGDPATRRLFPIGYRYIHTSSANAAWPQEFQAAHVSRAAALPYFFPFPIDFSLFNAQRQYKSSRLFTPARLEWPVFYAKFLRSLETLVVRKSLGKPIDVAPLLAIAALKFNYKRIELDSHGLLRQVEQGRI